MQQPVSLVDITVQYLRLHLPQDCIYSLCETKTVYISPCYGAFTLEGLKKIVPDSVKEGELDWDHLYFNYNLSQLVLDPTDRLDRVYCLITLPATAHAFTSFYTTNKLAAMKEKVYRSFRHDIVWDSHSVDCWCSVGEPPSVEVHRYSIDQPDKLLVYSVKELYELKEL